MEIHCFSCYRKYLHREIYPQKNVYIYIYRNLHRKSSIYQLQLQPNTLITIMLPSQGRSVDALVSITQNHFFFLSRIGQSRTHQTRFIDQKGYIFVAFGITFVKSVFTIFKSKITFLSSNFSALALEEIFELLKCRSCYII